MIDVNVKIHLFFYFSLFPAFGFFSIWGSKFQTLMAPRLDFSNWWAKDTCKGNPVVVTMENPNFSVVVLKKISSHHSSNGKGERDQIEGKAREREREREREIIFVLHHRLFSSPSPTTCSPDGLELITAFFF